MPDLIVLGNVIPTPGVPTPASAPPGTRFFSGPRRSWRVRYFAANNKVLNFDDFEKYIPTMRHGFGVPEPVFSTSQPLRGDGAALTKMQTGPRDIELPVYLRCDRGTTLNQHRKELMEAMDPALGDGLLEYHDFDSGQTWNLICRPRHCAIDTQVGSGKMHLEALQWRAFDPNWYGPIHEVPIAPNGAQFDVFNNGTVEVGWKLVLPGQVVNPSITNETTGAGLSITTYVDPDHTLRVSTVQNQKYVVITDNQSATPTRDAYANRVVRSTYWSLALGLNTIVIDSNPRSPFPLNGTFSWQYAVRGV